MSTIRYQVFISPTFADLKDQRQILWQRLTDYGYIVAGMENFPSTSDEPFEYIKPLIDNSDFFILVVGDRYGTHFGESGKSYTEAEFDYAIEIGMPILVFPLNDDIARSSRTSDVDKIAAEKLEKFLAKAMHKRMVRRWSTGEDLASVAVQALSFESIRKPRPGWVRGSTASAHELSDEIVRLRHTVAQLEERLSQLPTMSVEEMDTALSKEVYISSRHIESNTLEYLWVDIKRILRLESIFSEFNAKSIRQSMEIICESDTFEGKYKNSESHGALEVNPLDLDVVIILLRKNGIIDFDIANNVEEIRRGRNWITALEVCKLSGPIRPRNAS